MARDSAPSDAIPPEPSALSCIISRAAWWPFASWSERATARSKHLPTQAAARFPRQLVGAPSSGATAKSGVTSENMYYDQTLRPRVLSVIQLSKRPPQLRVASRGAD